MAAASTGNVSATSGIDLNPQPDSSKADLLAKGEVRIIAVGRKLDLSQWVIRLSVGSSARRGRSDAGGHQ